MPAIYVLLKKFSSKYLDMHSERPEVGLWSWRTIHNKSDHPSHLHTSASELELVPVDAPTATINTIVERDDVDDGPKYKEKRGRGIKVSKTVQRAENRR
jgi:hypothetical protein